jgi:hypothetical protein
MHLAHPIRVYTVLLALVCGLSIAYAVNASANADRAMRAQQTTHADLARMQRLVDRTIAHDRAVARANRRLVRRYNRLVVSTRVQLRAAAQRRASQAAARAQLAAAAASAAVAAPAVQVASAPAPSPVSAPATQTS